MKSVLQDWVMELPLRHQGVILAAIRGPDGVPKEDAAKPIVRTIRGCVMNAGETGRPLRYGEVLGVHDVYMRMDHLTDWEKVVADFLGSMDQYNIHFYQHLMHAAGVIGYTHPEVQVAVRMEYLYKAMVRKLHNKPETKEELTHRLRDGRRNKEDE